MRLTVLGTCSPYPLPGRACPGYLLEVGGKTVLLDCGSGVAERLLKFTDYDRLDAIVLSHLHGDHTSDMWVIRYAVDAYLRQGRRRGPLAVYAPPEPAAEFSLLPYKESFRVMAAGPGQDVDLGDGVTMSFLRTAHSLPCNAVTFRHGGAKFTYSADTSYTEEMANFAAGADLFLCEATLQESVKEFTRLGHLTAVEAARLGQQARVKRLLLTHFTPELDAAVTEREARATFRGVLQMAMEEAVYEF